MEVYENLKIEIGNDERAIEISEMYMKAKVNTFTICHVEFTYKNIHELSVIKDCLESNQIYVYLENVPVDECVIFQGYFDDYIIKLVNDSYVIIIDAISYAKRLDMKSLSRSFQNVSMTHCEVIEESLKTVDNVIFNFNDEEIAIGKPLIQYQETPWKFIMRVASESGNVIYDVAEHPTAYLLIKSEMRFVDFGVEVEEIRSGVDSRFFELGGTASGFGREQFLYYDVVSKKNFSIGKKTFYKNTQLIIYEKKVQYSAGEVKFYYKLGAEGNEIAVQQRNDKLSGMSLVGTVIEAKNETVKVHFAIDESQDVATAYAFEWTPVSGNMMYCVPKVGTQVDVYFGSNEEINAKAVNCVRTNGSTCQEMKNYTDRGFMTDHGKNLKFAENQFMLLSSSSNGEEKKLDMTADLMALVSDKPVNIVATEEIEIKATTYVASSQQDLTMVQIGENVNEASLSAPQATLCMSGDSDCYAENDIFISTGEPTRYEFFEDNPEEGDETKLFLNILSRIVVGAVVVAAVAVTVASAGVAGPILAGVIVGGGAAIASVAISDAIDGNCSSLGEYIISTVSGMISGAACAAIAPFGPTSSGMLKYIFQSVAAGTFSSALDNTITMAFEDMFGIENYTFDEYLESTIWSAITGGIAGGIFGGLSLGARKIFSSTLFSLQKAKIPQAEAYLADLAKGLKWSSADVTKALEDVYGKFFSRNDLIRAFTKDPAVFFIQKTSGLLSLTKGVMPGAVESTLVTGLIDAPIDNKVDDYLSEDVNRYVEGFILVPAE